MKSQSHRFSNEKLLEILSLSQNATAIFTGEEITIQSANDVMLGFWDKDKTVIGTTLADALPELENQEFIPLIKEVWRTGTTYQSKDAPARLMVNGEIKTFYFDFVYQAILNDAGEVDCILHTATDVTELNLGRNLIIEGAKKQEVFDREQALNEELTSANEELAATLEELNATNQQLQIAKDNVQWLNEQLEIRVEDRTITIETLNQDLEAFNEELKATNEELLSTIDDLAASENRTKTIIEAAPFPIGIYTGREMRITFLNQSIINAWGKGNDLIGRLYSDVLPELNNQEVYEQLDKVFTTGIPFEARNQRIELVVDGLLKVFYFNYNFTPLRNDDGSIYGIMNTAADVTDAVVAKQLIEEGAKELASLNDRLAAINEELIASNESQNQTNDELAAVNKKLRISQDELQLAISAAGLATFDLDTITNKFTGNDLLKSWFSLKLTDEIPLEKATDVIAGADRERVLAAIKGSMSFESGGDYDTHYSIINPENTEARIVRAKGKIQFNEFKVAVRLTGVLQDVTEQVMAEDKLNKLLYNLEASEKRFRSLIKQAPVAMNVFKTSDLIIDIVNDKMLEIWGENQGVNGKKFVDAIPEMASLPFISILEEVFETGITYHGEESKISLVKNGVSEERYFNFVYQPVYDEDGSFDRVLQVVSEVTEQVNARKEIADINTRLNIAIDAGELGSTEIDLATCKMKSNTQFKKCFGLSDNDAFNYTDLFEVMLPQHRDKVKKIIAFAEEHNTVFKAEYEVTWPDGSIHWINAHGKARYDSDGRAVKLVSIVSDITEFKADEQRKDDFIGMVSHELKTPLTSLTAYIQMLQVKAGVYEDEFISNALDMANKQVRKMTNMINGFLNISRLESGKIHIDSQRFNMAELVKEVEAESIITVTSHKVIFAPVEETYVVADKDKIAMVINNFISNAVKYSYPDSTIHIACISNDGSVEVSVKDQGRGIKKEDQDKLFERYYRVKDQPDSIAGFGIGLYVCAEVIQRHNGKIWVESEEGNGAAFYFTIPM